jgi:hypothetical protein
MAHNIKLPKGVRFNTKGGGGTFDFDSGFDKKYSDAFNRAQRVADSEVLRYNDPYIPMDTGKLKQSGIINTDVGSGEVVYKTPYARRWYYDDANFQGAPMRGKQWFERMKADHKEDIVKSARKELGKT